MEVDEQVGATYFTLRESGVSTTVSVSDLVMVDLGEDGDPVGVEFAFPIPQVTHDEWLSLFNAFPALKEVFGDAL